jgi:hypothetical protein
MSAVPSGDSEKDRRSQKEAQYFQQPTIRFPLTKTNANRRSETNIFFPRDIRFPLALDDPGPPVNMVEEHLAANDL